jgi:hypothetical protein
MIQVYATSLYKVIEKETKEKKVIVLFFEYLDGP